MNTGQISLGIILAYLCFMLAITVLNGRKKKQKNAEGFFLANRGVSSVLLPLTMIAAMQLSLIHIYNYNKIFTLLKQKDRGKELWRR